MLDFIRQWRGRREAAAIERATFERTVKEFVADTRPFVPVAAKYPEAALYRHAWKRAVALQEIYQERSDASRAAYYERARKSLASAYHAVAPSNAYGSVRLRIDPEAFARLKQAELGRMSLLCCAECRTDDDPTEPLVKSPVECPRCGARYTSGVYVLSNTAMPGLVKIGHTTKSLRDRMAQLSAATGVPKPFELEAWFPCPPRLARRHERAIRLHFDSRRTPSREFFSVDVEEALTVAGRILGRPSEFRPRGGVRVSMQPVELRCTRCGVTNLVSPVAQGKTVQCGSCHEPLRVDSATAG